MNTLALYIIHADGLVNLLIWLIGMGIIFYLLWWLIAYIALPEPFAKVARVILAFVAVIILIDLILSLTGNGPGFGGSIIVR
jgi:hypothetical protein